MKNSFLLIFLTAALAIGSIRDSVAATCTSLSAGNWNTASNWSCGTVPSGSDVVVISHAMTLSANTTFSAWSGTLSMTINNGGSLKVTGDLTLQGASMRFTVNNGGTLDVSGTLTTTNGGATLTVNNGGTLKAGTLAVNATSTVNMAGGSTATLTNLTTSNNNDAILNNTGTMNISGNISSSGLINNYGTMNVTGNVTQNNTGNVFTNSGNLTVTGNVVADGKIQLNPGVSADSRTLVSGNFTVSVNENLLVGTNVNPPNYADLVVKKDLLLTGGGDVTINKNGRVAVFGNVTGSGGGDTRLTVNSGGQMYVDKNVSLTGNGDSITNNNTVSPYGLYVNGTTSNTGGGSTTTSNKANKATMQSTNAPFANWVATQSSTMPVSLIYFKVKQISSSSVTLTWATVSELNFDHFEVERSTDGISFSLVGKIKGNGTTTIRHEYDWRDGAAVTGRNYYRLKSVDFDGYVEFFNVVVADVVNESSVSIYPNPVSDGSVHIDLSFNPEHGASVFITDMTGSTVASLQFEERSIVLPVNMNPGIYVVSVISDGFKSVSRLMVR